MCTVDSENCNARPLRVTQSDSRSDELKRRVTTATPVRSPMEQGKEPSQRSFELTAHEWVRQEDIAHSPRFTGDFAWRLSGSHADAHRGPRTADYDCLRARFRANIWIVAQHMGCGPSFAERVASPDVSPYPDCKTQSLCVQTNVSCRSNVCRVPKQKQRR